MIAMKCMLSNLKGTSKVIWKRIEFLFNAVQLLYWQFKYPACFLSQFSAGVKYIKTEGEISRECVFWNQSTVHTSTKRNVDEMLGQHQSNILSTVLCLMGSCYHKGYMIKALSLINWADESTKEIRPEQ